MKCLPISTFSSHGSENLQYCLKQCTAFKSNRPIVNSPVLFPLGQANSQKVWDLSFSAWKLCLKICLYVIQCIWLRVCFLIIRHQPGGKRGSKIWETICSCFFFRARAAGSKIYILPFTVVFKLLLSRDDGRRRWANQAARVAFQNKTIKEQTHNQKKF